jgi:hypothetical protein
VSNNQEMQFADPAWEPRKTQGSSSEEEMPPFQPLETNISGPTRSGLPNEPEHEYAQGYQTQTRQAPNHTDTFEQEQAQQSSFQTAQQPHHHHLPTWIWVLIFALVFGGISGPAFHGPISSLFSLIVVGLVVCLFWLLFTRRVTVNLSGERLQPETHTFEVSTLPRIVINNKAGSIHLHAGPDDQVSITTTKRGYIFNQQLNRDVDILYSQDKTNNSISARATTWKPFGKTSIDFDITVPAHANLELTTNAGNISVENITGEMVLKTEFGSIHAIRATLQNRSRLKTDAGSVHFTGSLDPNGDYLLTTDLGNINVSLPADSSFRLEAKTDLGSVNTQIPFLQQQRNRAFGQVGPGPWYPRLKLKTDMGSVNLERR